MDTPPDRRDERKTLATREGLAGFSMVGKTPQKWQESRQKLLERVFVLFEQLADEKPPESWLREQAKEFGAMALDYAKAHLRKPGLDAAKVEAEVAKLYAEREKTLAEARKTNVEASEQELDQKIKKLKLCLVMTKASLVGDDGDEAIMIGLQIDEMLVALKEIASK